MAILVLENQTVSTIVVDDVGVPVPGSGTYDIQPQDYGYWAASVDIDTHLTSGDLILQRDGVDLSSDDAKELLHRLRILKVLNDSTLIKRDIIELDFDDSFDVTDGGYGRASISLSSESVTDVVVGATSTVDLNTTALSDFCAQNYTLCMFNESEDRWRTLKVLASKVTSASVEHSIYGVLGDRSLDVDLDFKVVSTNGVLEAVNNESFPVTVRYRLETI